MNGQRNRGLGPWLLGICLIAACFAFGSVVAGAATTAGKSRTNVSIRFSELGANDFRYTVRVRPRKCRKNRRVIVFHDENGNGRLDGGEFVIGKGRTNRRGKYVLASDVAPPDGDKIGVLVKKNRKCRSGRAGVTRPSGAPNR